MSNSHDGQSRFKPTLTEKRWDPSREVNLLALWESEGLHRFDAESPKPSFSIDTPPPYASGRWHVGGAVHYTQIDMVARYQRMKGCEVLFSFGIDRNGLPVEVEVEKKHNIRARDVEREQFIKLCHDFLSSVENEIVALARRLGMSCDFEHMYRTDSPEYRCLTQETFLGLWNRGFIQENECPSNWCSVCATTIADAEIEYSPLETKLCFIRFAIKEDGNVLVATTRPELLCSCAALIYNPEDSRYADLKGKHAVTPLYSVEVPIIPSWHVKPEFGTGIAMVCSYGDHTDIQLFRELNLTPQVAIDDNGRMNNIAGMLKGLRVQEARERIVGLLKDAVERQEKIQHNTPICWRSKTPIEFIHMKEYYLNQLSFVEDLKTMVDDVEFHPPESKLILLNWINSVNSDWPISRRRFYGTEIPLWYCEDCSRVYAPPSGRYYQPWREPPPEGRCVCGGSSFRGETRTLDTWMDSSLTQLFIMGYQRDAELFKRLFPCSLRPQGMDIVRTWLYYSILRTYQLLKKPAFSHVRISGMGLDPQGQAMHKSKGNVIFPEDAVNQLGADAFRLWGASEAKLGSNYRYNHERLDGLGKFITKLWNISRFISCFPLQRDAPPLPATDRLILAELNDVIHECEKGYEAMEFFIPAQALRGFMWNVFADHYVEAVKARAYNTDNVFSLEQQQGAWFTLHQVLSTCLKLLAPICPFITDILWREIYGGKSVHIETYPQPQKQWDNDDIKHALPSFIEFNSAIWRFKKGRNLPLTSKLRSVHAPPILQEFRMDLQAMHRIQMLEFTEPPPATAAQAEKAGEIYIQL